MKIRRLFITGIFIMTGIHASAQIPLDSAAQVIRIEAVSNNIKSKLATPYGGSALSNFVSNIHVSSTFNEGVNGKVELQTKLKSGWTGGLSLEQKIGKSDDEAIPFSLTGISPGTTLQFNFQKMFWNPGFGSLSNNQIKKLNEAEKAYAKRNNIDDFRTIGLREISLNGTEEEKKMALETFNAAFKEPLFLNARLGFTKTSFNYSTDSINLTSTKEAFLTPTLSVSLIKVLGSGFKVTGYFALNYNFSIYYQGGSAMTFNIPFGNTPNYYTRTLTFGKPSKQTDNTISAEYRLNFSSLGSGENPLNIAISPSLNLAIESNMMGLFLPVYFIRSADSKGKVYDNLSGGIRLGYISSTENFESFGNGFLAELILSAPLDFLKTL